MEILKNGSMEKAAEFDEKNDIKVRFECGRCGCEFVASSFAGECVRTSLSMPDVTEKWTAKCPEFGCQHACYSDDEIIGDDMDGVKVCGLCEYFDRFESDSSRGLCHNNHKFGVLCVSEHACDSFNRRAKTSDCWRGEYDPKAY